MTIVLFLSSWPEVNPKNAFTPMPCRCAISFSSPSLSLISSMRLNSSASGLRLGGVDRLFIHPAGVVIAHLLHLRRKRRVGFRLGGLLGRHAQRFVILFDQGIEAAPARFFRWDGIVLQPGAIRVGVEIVLRLDRGIHVLQIERRRVFLDLGARLRSVAGGVGGRCRRTAWRVAPLAAAWRAERFCFLRLGLRLQTARAERRWPEEGRWT